MAEKLIKILALSGSLRANSTNSSLLHAAVDLAPPHVQVDFFDCIGRFPLFNPDREPDLYRKGETGIDWDAPSPDPELEIVRELNNRIREADGLLVACPEYARGVPGAFKNALDWLVGGNGFVDKPFAQFNASPRAMHAQAALRLTLETMSGWAVEDACIALPLINRNLDAASIVADQTLAAAIRSALADFATAIVAHREKVSITVPK